MVFENYLMPFMPNHTKSILDYDVKIENLRPEATFFVPAETGKLWNIKLLRLPYMTCITNLLQKIMNNFYQEIPVFTNHA